MNNFEQIDAIYKRFQNTLQPIDRRINFKIPHAKELLKVFAENYLKIRGENFTYLQEYDQIAEWLADNKGKGLFLFGNCGLGKTMIVRHVITPILLIYINKVVKHIDAPKLGEFIYSNSKIGGLISVDDVGTETLEKVIYGDRIIPFSEFMDSCEKNDALPIITTNLTAKQIVERYGDRTLDRIKSTCVRICLTGDSFRS